MPVTDREIEAQHELRGQLNDAASQGELARAGGGEH